MFCGGSGLGDSDDQSALSGFDDIIVDGVELINLHDALDLREETFEQPEVPAGDPHDGSDGLRVSEIVGIEGFAQ